MILPMIATKKAPIGAQLRACLSLEMSDDARLPPGAAVERHAR